jgi:hypothetical protein
MPITGTPRMSSPYLDHPLLPLAVALPLLLEKVEAELANKKLEAARREHFHRRAEMIRGLLPPSPIT